MEDLLKRKRTLLVGLKTEMNQALINNPNVRLFIENMDLMNLTHLVTKEDLIIDLESLVNTVLEKNINNKPHLKLTVEVPRTTCPKCQSTIK